MSIQNFDTFAATVSGFKYLPASLATQAITVTAGVLTGYLTWDTVRDVIMVWDENRCSQVMNLDLQDVITIAGRRNWISHNKRANRKHLAGSWVTWVG